jgi:uncharacterized membrane protein YkoI
MFSSRTVLAISLAANLTLVPRAVFANAPHAAPPQGNGQESVMTSKGDLEDDVERVIPVEQLPEAVYSALMSLGKGGKVQQVEMSIDKGRATYEIDLLLGNVYYEVEYAEDGRMIASEVEAWIVSLDSVPAPVRSAFEREAEGGPILEVRKEQEDNTQFVFEADINNGARTYILRIDAQGTLIERDITLEMLPPGAYSSITRAAQGGWVRELDEELHNGEMFYEANIVIGSKEIELSVDADGKVVELDL